MMIVVFLRCSENTEYPVAMPAEIAVAKSRVGTVYWLKVSVAALIVASTLSFVSNSVSDTAALTARETWDTEFWNASATVGGASMVAFAAAHRCCFGIAGTHADTRAICR